MKNENDLLIFEDWNCPGCVYIGTRKHMEGLRLEGGFPVVVGPKRINAEGLV